MKVVYVARLIGSKGRIWVAFDGVEVVKGTTDMSKREVLERYAALHGAYTAVAELGGVHRPAELDKIILRVSLAGDA
jgi:hypothetical protein